MDNDVRTMSYDQMDAFVTTEASRFERADRTLATAREAVENLRRQDPASPIDRMRLDLDLEAARSRLAEAEANASKVIGTVVLNMDSLVTSTEGTHVKLTDAEMALANNRASFIREDAERLSLDEIRQQIENAIRMNDRPAMFCWLRYGKERLAKGEKARFGSRTGTDKSDVRRLLRQVEGRLSDPTVEGVREKAAELRSRALRTQTGVQRHARARGDRKPFAFQASDSTRWPKRG